ncbi:MAG: hypothetical protein U1D30_18805 [Planctomycetota bacterium]
MTVTGMGSWIGIDCSAITFPRPFGLMAEGNDVVVIHKPELLRLSDKDDDGRAEHAEVLATGWGVTFDYHDWAVGLVKDKENAYYIAPSVQQDSRSPASALGRGKVLRISGDGKIEEFAAGIRFAMGIAMDARGEIFTTDNQGNSNPFNELNHIRQEAFWLLEPVGKGRKNQVVEPRHSDSASLESERQRNYLHSRRRRLPGHSPAISSAQNTRPRPNSRRVSKARETPFRGAHCR